MTKNLKELFNETQKAEAFDRLAERYYNRNFGQIGKSDIDLLMFDILMKRMIEEYTIVDTLDYSQCSDYKLSIVLGITQQRVRNLKVKRQLVYGAAIEWRKGFAKLIADARYENGKVLINIPDPNLFIEIQEFLEENGAYVETQLNKKLLQVRAEYFIDLIAATETGKRREEIKNELRNAFRNSRQDDHGFDEKHMGRSLIKESVNIGNLLLKVESILDPQNELGKSILGFIQNNMDMLLNK